jgi:hypothetical protein
MMKKNHVKLERFALSCNSEIGWVWRQAASKLTMRLVAGELTATPAKAMSKTFLCLSDGRTG